MSLDSERPVQTSVTTTFPSSGLQYGAHSSDVAQSAADDRRIPDGDALFRITFERAGVGIAHLSPDGRWLRANEPLSLMLGYSMDELLTLTFQDITHPDDLAADVSEADRLLRGEISSYSVEKRYLRQDGSVVWAKLTASVAFDATGAPEYVIAVIRDITDRKNTDAERLQAERDYRTLFENSHDLVLIVDPVDGAIVNANRRAADVYGYGVEELIGKPISLLTQELSRSLEQMARVAAGDPEVRFESVHRRRDGSLVLVHVALAAVTYGGRTAVLATCRDVTEEDRLIRALAASERRLRQIADQGFDMVAIFDAAGVVRFASGSVTNVLGYTPEDLVGKARIDIVHPDDRASVLTAFGAVATQRMRQTVVCRIASASGAWRWCEGTAVNMMDIEGVNGVVLIARDITERRELEARLDQARRVESLGKVAATVAHEFNNLLMAFQPIADLLERRHGSSEGVVALARQLAAGVQRGRSVAAGILRFATPSQPARQRFKAAGWLARVAHELRGMVSSRIHLTAFVDPRLVIDADLQQLHQLVTNLAINAADAQPDGGTIEIRAGLSCDGARNCAEITVTDSGPGIPQELRDRIFDPLFTTKRHGTGLGLSLCQQIVASHGGTISVTAADRGGAKFIVRLPAASMVEVPMPASRTRLLLVEDDALVAAALTASLDETFQIEWVTCAGEALERVESFDPEVVLLDIQLPDGDGREVHAKLRKLNDRAAVVLMSGSVIDSRRVDGRTAFLPKPFSSADLQATLASMEA